MDLLPIIFIAALGALAFASLRWGADSTEPIDSRDWARRAAWHGVAGAAPTAANRRSAQARPTAARTGRIRNPAIRFVLG